MSAESAVMFLTHTHQPMGRFARWLRTTPLLGAAQLNISYRLTLRG
jgi:hypothetical protein